MSISQRLLPLALPVILLLAAGSFAPGNSLYPPTNRSSTITLGNTAQTLMAANPARHDCLLQNLSTGDEWISFDTTAVIGGPSIWLPAGASALCSQIGAGFGAGSIIGPATGASYAAKEW